MEADRVVAVIGKTEGNGGVNDYTRIIADRAFREVLEARGTRSMEDIKQIPIVWSGGTDGVISPHATIFATTDAAKVPATDEPRLSVGYAMSEQIRPEDIGRLPIRSAGLDGLPARAHSSDRRGRVVNVFCKCEADPTGRVRDRRNIMLDGSDVHWHRQIKSCVGGVVASVTGDPAVFVSVAAVHQGPAGGGPVIAIVDHSG